MTHGTKLYYKLPDRTLALEYCDRALSIATELGIPLAKECQELKEKLLSGNSTDLASRSHLSYSQELS